MEAARFANPTSVALTLRAFRRFPDQVAFVWDAGRLTYAGAAKLIGGMQHAMQRAGLRKGMRLALLSGNRAEAWCAGVAAQGMGLSITWLHPLGSLSDHSDQVTDSEAGALVVDVPTYRDRGGELAARTGMKTVLTLGAADYGDGPPGASRGRRPCRGAGCFLERGLCHPQLHRRHDRQVERRASQASLDRSGDAGGSR